MNMLIFDIETGPLPWEQIAQFYEAPPELPPWEDAMCKMGNLKDEAKRAEKLAAATADYAALMAADSSKRDAHKCHWASRAALSPMTGRVLAIGIQKEERTCVIGIDGETEPEILEIFWSVYKKYHGNGGRLVGWNSNGFDVPFLVRRSWFHGVVVPESVRDKTGRYLSSTFVDLMQLWGCGAREYEKLDTVCRWTGIGGKPDGVDGGHFAALWNSGDEASRMAAIDYLKNDLFLTYKIAERMGVIS